MSEEGAVAAVGRAPRKRRWGRVVASAIALVFVALAIYVGHAFWVGDMAPADAAAKYDGFNYLAEDEVTDYIQLYREQMGLAESSDEDWATFLAAYNLTPSRLRYSTIQQLITDALVQKKADELGLQASDDEIEATVDTLRNTLGLGDDEILKQTLEAHGQTEEGLREVYRQAIVKRMLLSSEVETPTPSDEQVKEYLKSIVPSMAVPTVRHTYCFKLNNVNQEGDLDALMEVQHLSKQFSEGEKTTETFERLVEENSDDETLIETGGANGWDIDSSSYSNDYLGVLEGMTKGDVSEAFHDGESLCFIWVDDEFALPSDSKDIDELDPSDVPTSLWQYLSDAAAYSLWESAGQDYLAQLLDDAGVVYYPMPSDVPYNVDMSLADVQLEEVADEK